MSVVGCESVGGFPEALSDDQGEENQGEEHLGDSFSCGGFHLRGTACHKPFSVSSTGPQILQNSQCLWG